MRAFSLLNQSSKKLKYNSISLMAPSAKHVWCSDMSYFCNPLDCSLPGSSVHGIFQARILEWVAISSFGGSSQPQTQTQVSCVSYVGRWILYH